MKNQIDRRRKREREKQKFWITNRERGATNAITV